MAKDMIRNEDYSYTDLAKFFGSEAQDCIISLAEKGMNFYGFSARDVYVILSGLVNREYALYNWRLEVVKGMPERE